MSGKTGFEIPKKEVPKPEPRRYFGGKLTAFISRDEANLQKKHLRAYLRGYKEFVHGFYNTIMGRKPMTYKVQEIWK